MPPCAGTSRSPWSFRKKLFVTLTVFTALISATFTAMYTYRQIRCYRDFSAEKSQLLATMLAAAVRLPLYSEDKLALMRLAGEYSRYPGVKGVSIINAEGRVMAQAGRPTEPERERQMAGSAPVTPGLMGSSAGYLLGVSARDEKPLGRVRVVMDQKELALIIRSMVTTSVFTALLFWVATTIISYFLVSRMTRALSSLIAGIRALRGGNYTLRIAPVERGEFGDAAVAVNELAAELLRREEENRRLQQDLIEAMRLKMSEERKKMMAKLIQTNRMTSLGLLVSSMAHEINTPNGAIKLAAQQIAKAWKSAVPILDGVAREEGDFLLGGGPYSMVREEFSTATDVVARSSERIGQVIKDLRDFSAGERSEFRHDVDVNQVIREAVAIIRAHGRYGNIGIVSEISPELPPVVGNRHQLGQVVINLLLNGMQAIAEGRTGTVGVAAQYDAERGEVTVRVSDDGEGIDPEHLGQLVEPFFSTRLQKGGSGLGLYISNFIITEHHGSMDFESELGKGTVITVRLPAKGEANR